MNRRFDDKELGSANAGFSLKYLIVREQKRIGHTMAASSYHSLLPSKKVPPHSEKPGLHPKIRTVNKNPSCCRMDCSPMSRQENKHPVVE